MKNVRRYIFLRDVFMLSWTAFGGPQAHIAMFIQTFVVKRGYLTEEELLELNALCQILPGPTSTQTITAIGFRFGGPGLAYLTLLIWALPAVTIMTIAGLTIITLEKNNLSLEFTRFIQPMAVGFVIYAAYVISSKVIKTNLALGIMMVSAVISYFFRLPWVFPLLLIAGGSITAFRYKKHPREEDKKLKIQWGNLILWAGVFVGSAALGGITDLKAIRIFENFYRNGSLIFGGGQVLIPLMYSEFVEFKEYLSGSEFLTGYSMVQALPGPVFSFSAYIGALSMRPEGTAALLSGSLMAALGIFLPGTFLIFFIIRFWDELKKYRIVKASLEGINAASSGMVVAAALFMFQPVEKDALNLIIIAATFVLLTFTKVPAPVLILMGLVSGVIFQFI